MMSAWGFQCLSNFEGNFVFSVGLGLSDASDEMNESIQGEPKVDILYIVNYCIPTFGSPCTYSSPSSAGQLTIGNQIKKTYKNRTRKLRSRK